MKLVLTTQLVLRTKNCEKVYILFSIWTMELLQEEQLQAQAQINEEEVVPTHEVSNRKFVNIDKYDVEFYCKRIQILLGYSHNFVKSFSYIIKKYGIVIFVMWTLQNY
jgi:hypothetical protein